MPRLCVDPTGKLLLSWVEERKTVEGPLFANLRFSLLEDGRWTPPRTVASGDRWFVNWADFPAVAAIDAKTLVAHFLERSAEGTYDYAVQVVRSRDGGESWSTPERLHSDAGAGEHGFVTWATSSAEELAAVWLDGRNTGAHGKEEGPGAMALYTRTVHADGSMGEEVLLDERVCDCCQTAAIRAADGALVVAYRDRSSDEVRDISIVRLAPGGAPVRVWTSGDGWKIAGCPVNGPVLAAENDSIGLAWFTLGSNGKSKVLCSFSRDAGKSFSKPTDLAEEGALGRVDAVFDAQGRLVVIWLEVEGERSVWRVARVERDGSVMDVNSVADASSGRDSGLARLSMTARGILFAYVEPGEEPRVGAKLLEWGPKDGR